MDSYSDTLDDYELGGVIAEATGGSTRWVDPAVVEEVVDRYRRPPWYWRLWFRLSSLFDRSPRG